MTTFDPAFAREVLERRQSALLKEASALHWDKWCLVYEEGITPYGPRADAFDKKIHALWDEADSYDSVLAYLDGRIWSEKSVPEKIWSHIEDWDLDISKEGWLEGVVGDVLEAGVELDLIEIKH